MGTESAARAAVRLAKILVLQSMCRVDRQTSQQSLRLAVGRQPELPRLWQRASRPGYKTTAGFPGQAQPRSPATLGQTPQPTPVRNSQPPRTKTALTML